MKKIAIYYRCSTDKQDLESQKLAIGDWLKKQEWYGEPRRVYKVYEDEGVSGKTMDRPAIKKLKSDAMRGRFHQVIVFKLDRLSRSVRDSIRTILWLSERKIDFISVSEDHLQVHKDRPEGMMMLSMLATFAELEHKQIVERVNAGIAAAKKRGVKFGPPQKYSGAIVQRMVDLKQSGLSYREIGFKLQIPHTTVRNCILRS